MKLKILKGNKTEDLEVMFEEFIGESKGGTIKRMPVDIKVLNTSEDIAMFVFYQEAIIKPQSNIIQQNKKLLVP